MSATILPNIAFIGRAGSGKTTCREILEEQYGYQRFSWAAPLKVGCATNDDRALLQKVGHGVRELYADFWVNLGLMAMDEASGAAYHPYANDDTRYPNEAAALKGRGFVIVRLVAPTVMRRDRLMRNGRLQHSSQLDHVSETSLDDFEHDHRIINDRWTDDLEHALQRIINEERS